MNITRYCLFSLLYVPIAAVIIQVYAGVDIDPDIDLSLIAEMARQQQDSGYGPSPCSSASSAMDEQLLGLGLGMGLQPMTDPTLYLLAQAGKRGNVSTAATTGEGSHQMLPPLTHTYHHHYLQLHFIHATFILTPTLTIIISSLTLFVLTLTFILTLILSPPPFPPLLKRRHILCGKEHWHINVAIYS